MLNRPYSKNLKTQPNFCEANLDVMLAPSPKQVTLTAKEKQILMWVTWGKSSWEIAQILTCSESGINFHLSNIRRKFGVSSRYVAMRLAMDQGLI